MNKMSASGYCVLASIFFVSTTGLMAQEAVMVVEETKPKEIATVTVDPAVPAETPQAPVKAMAIDEPISLTFDNTPFLDVIKAFRDVTSANLVTTGTNVNAITVSMRLDNVPWKQGLDSILFPQGLEAVEQPSGSGVYLIRNRSNEIPKFTKAFKLAFARAADVALLLKTTFDLAMPTAAAPSPVGASNKGTVSAYPSANTVIVTAPQQQLDECEKILAQIDVQRPQVYIEARFMELSASASRKLGLQWNTLGRPDGWGVNFEGAAFGMNGGRSRDNRLTKTGNDSLSWTQTDGVTPPGTTILTGNTAANGVNLFNEFKDQYFSGALSADAFRLALNAFDELGDDAVFSNPRVIVANEEEATIDMTEKYPNLSLETTPIQIGNTMTLKTTAKLETIPGKKEIFVGEAFFSYGITLKVTPRISPTGLITIVIEPAISSKIGDYLISEDQSIPLPKYPIIEMKRINTTFTMNDGYTAVIGGLTQTKEISVDNGIPYLRSIPWIGPYLFGWKSRVKDQKEIIIFVTVGLADPATMKMDAGLPKNAVLGREFVTGARKEPGDRTKAELLSLDMKEVGKRVEPAVKAVSEIQTTDDAVAPTK